MTISDRNDDLRYRIVSKDKKPANQQQLHLRLQDYMLLTLFSVLLSSAIVQVVSCQSVSASKILTNKSMSLDNTTSSSSSTSFSTKNLSEKEDHEMNSIPKIHTHMSGEKGIFVNGYLVETPNGVVVIDSALTVSESKAL